MRNKENIKQMLEYFQTSEEKALEFDERAIAATYEKSNEAVPGYKDIVYRWKNNGQFVVFRISFYNGGVRFKNRVVGVWGTLYCSGNLG